MASLRPCSAHVFLLVTQVTIWFGASAQGPEQTPPSADISVSGIFLHDPESVKKVLGNAPTPSEDASPKGDNFPTLKACNSTKTELLVLIFHYGDVTNSYSEFRIGGLPNPRPGCLVPPGGVVHFVTGRGIRLGISRKELVGILGQGFSERREGNETVIRYTIADFEKSTFLKRYNMPVYYGSYRLKQGKLVGFEFGFVNP